MQSRRADFRHARMDSAHEVGSRSRERFLPTPEHQASHSPVQQHRYPSMLPRRRQRRCPWATNFPSAASPVPCIDRHQQESVCCRKSLSQHASLSSLRILAANRRKSITARLGCSHLDGGVSGHTIASAAPCLCNQDTPGQKPAPDKPLLFRWLSW